MLPSIVTCSPKFYFLALNALKHNELAKGYPYYDLRRYSVYIDYI